MNMEILVKNNKNLLTNKTEFGCVCPSCESVFIFDDSDIIRPRCINYDQKKCNTICPICGRYITIDKCIEFKSLDDKLIFKHKYDE